MSCMLSATDRNPPVNTAALPFSFVAGLLIGGSIAGAAEDFLILWAGGITVGAFGGALVVFVAQREPDFNAGIGWGSLLGGLLGLALAVADALGEA